MLHLKCINKKYINGPDRGVVPEKNILWETPFPEYAPVFHEDHKLSLQPVWADKPSNLSEAKFNQLDGKVNRESHEGPYKIDPVTCLPLNPRGRTGITGRGILGRWGPNRAADPVVTRLKKDSEGNFVLNTEGNRILQFVAIKRGDTGEWAIPGGMVDAGDTVSLTLRKEFGEEALNSIEASPEERVKLEKLLSEIFANGETVYSGYVDDPRNTDNAWMETVCVNFHDDDGSIFDQFKLHAGDDAVGVKWVDITPDIQLYASHTNFVHLVYKLLTGFTL